MIISRACSGARRAGGSVPHAPFMLQVFSSNWTPVSGFWSHSKALGALSCPGGLNPASHASCNEGTSPTFAPSPVDGSRQPKVCAYMKVGALTALQQLVLHFIGGSRLILRLSQSRLARFAHGFFSKPCIPWQLAVAVCVERMEEASLK